MINKSYTYIILAIFFVLLMGFTKSAPPISMTGLIPLNLTGSEAHIGPYIDKFDQREKHCLALALYGEARGETAESMEAVAWVIINRTNSIKFPNTVCGVVLQRSQFESLGPNTFLRFLAIESQNGTMAFPEMNNAWLANKLQHIAERVFYGLEQDPTVGATHFWSPTVQFALGRTAPKWSEHLAYKRDVGNHKFYR